MYIYKIYCVVDDYSRRFLSKVVTPLAELKIAGEGYSFVLSPMYVLTIIQTGTTILGRKHKFTSLTITRLNRRFKALS